MSYNMTAFGNATNIYLMVDAVNQQTNYLVGWLALVSIFVIMLINLLRNNPPPESFFAASFTSTLFGMTFFIIGFISIEWLIGCVIITALSGVALYLINRTS